MLNKYIKYFKGIYKFSNQQVVSSYYNCLIIILWERTELFTIIYNYFNDKND